MLRDLRYLFAYTVPISAFVAIYLGGWWSFLTVVYAFGFIPVVDQLLPKAYDNGVGEVTGRQLVDRFFDVLLYLNLPMFYALVVYFLYSASQQAFDPYELVGLVLSVGIVAGSLGINVAHELGHRTTAYEQFFAKALLVPCLYTHFFVEHNRGHHRRVATPEDPATSRFGESLYRFWIRSVIGSYRSAWALEYNRLQRAHQPVLSFQNEMVRFTLIQIGYLVAVGLLFGWFALGLAIGVAAVGILLLESVNYIEHYGLQRKLLTSGRYEPVTPRHSWNSEHELGRIVLYELTRHADHHFKSTRAYHELRYLPESPELPAGYPASILMALVPPLWFGVMNERVPELAA